jgi:RHH-type proline utilization regulon transcriptional repressor/proline dehydrogenase/delta 1-pyrroline-5-carboxylate dehydrogenase
MGEPMGRALCAAGERVRVYVPFGELLPGMAYLVRRLLENSSNDSFVRKAGEAIDASILLASPHTFEIPAPSRESVPDVADESESMTPFINEPEADFALVETQDAMRAALKAITPELGQVVPVVINGIPMQGRDIVDRGSKPRRNGCGQGCICDIG